MGKLPRWKARSRLFKIFPYLGPRRKFILFIGMAIYYQRCIKNFTEIAEPLALLLNRGSPNKLKLNEIQVGAFENLKLPLIVAPALATPDFSKDYILQTDVSDLRVGAVLTQRFGEEYPIAFCSRKPVPAEKRYSTKNKKPKGKFVQLFA
ncbi:hypothetical protein QYM36_008202 [Artemia franciscana]|uniref:Reverse transcriptase/retrotransposon-derived protein RNase H-like domain-containing protein n=1 Tax=Artemia franciscana TaxID=6661 RepID=A0AA88LMA6_ARTSF|nr:hypothetical protein QYM36_008202 [Artemia franciscana]